MDLSDGVLDVANLRPCDADHILYPPSSVDELVSSASSRSLPIASTDCLPSFGPGRNATLMC